MTRCPNGTRRNKKTGNCEPHEKTKRSPKGTGSLRVYQPRTPDYPPPPSPPKAALYLIHPNDMRSPNYPPSPRLYQPRSPDHSPPPHISSTQKRKKRKAASNTRKTQKPANWKIYKIDYVYPTITDSVSKDQRGFINIESIFLRNDNNSVAQIMLEGGKVEIVVDGHNATMKDLKKIGPNDISLIRFFGTENDEDGNYTTKENIAEIKSGVLGKLIKIEVSGKGAFYTLDNLNDSDKKQVLAKTIKLLKKI